MTEDPRSRRFFEAVSKDILDAPAFFDECDRLDPLDQTTSVAYRDLLRHSPAGVEILLRRAARYVADSMMSHLAGSTWISDGGRPVKLVFDDESDSSACREISPDYSLSLLDVLADLAEERGMEGWSEPTAGTVTDPLRAPPGQASRCE